MKNSISMISARALGAMPEFVHAEVGAKGLAHVMEKSDMPYVVLENRDFFIPQAKLVKFLGASAYLMGEQNLGLTLARYLTVRDYGIWGDYVLAAPTLGASLVRAQSSLKFHSATDTLRILRVNEGDLARFEYRFASAHINGYNHIACCAAGVVMSVFSYYLGRSWVPEWVELNIPKPHGWSVFEEAFGCPVVFDAANVAIVFQRECLESPAPENDVSCAPSLFDVSRERMGGSPTRLDDIVSEQIRLQLLDGAVSIEKVAAGLGMGIRKLQRELDGFGVSFRRMTNLIRLQRAKQLLHEPDLSITKISTELGYSAPAHFTRAFRKEAGATPREFRATLN